jgi:hypothetical protein
MFIAPRSVRALRRFVRSDILTFRSKGALKVKVGEGVINISPLAGLKNSSSASSEHPGRQFLGRPQDLLSPSG